MSHDIKREGFTLIELLVGTARGFDSRQGYRDADGVLSEDYTDASGNLGPLCVLPPAIHVSFVLIDAREAQRIGPTEKAALTTLAGNIASQTPKGNASDFVEAARNDPALKAISTGLHAHHAEINLLNAR